MPRPLAPDDSEHAIMRYEAESRRFIILVERNNITEMKAALAHGWGHCLHWSNGSVDKVLRQRMEHGAEWGKSYAKCYRIVFETES